MFHFWNECHDCSLKKKTFSFCWHQFEFSFIILVLVIRSVHQHEGLCAVWIMCAGVFDDSYHSFWSVMIKNATVLNSTFMSYMQQSSWRTLPKLPNISPAGVFTHHVLFTQRELRAILIGWRPLLSFYGSLTALFSWFSLAVDWGGFTGRLWMYQSV